MLKYYFLFAIVSMHSNNYLKYIKKAYFQVDSHIRKYA
jgi:hypothetical protein